MVESYAEMQARWSREDFARARKMDLQRGVSNPVGWPGNHRVTEGVVITASGERVLLRCVDCGEARLTVFDFTPRCSEILTSMTARK